jgi:hypothetical protein
MISLSGANCGTFNTFTGLLRELEKPAILKLRYVTRLPTKMPMKNNKLEVRWR